MCGAGPGVVAQLGGTGTDRLPREEETQRAPAAGADGLTWWADARPAPVAERVLHDAILARVVGDHYHATAGHERRAERRQRELELLELLIHDDPQHLEQPREVGRARSRAAGLADRVHEIVARRERRRGAPLHDGPCQAARARLVPELGERAGQARFGPGVQDVRGRHAVSRRHSHVERRPGTKGKPPGVAIELVGRDAEIEEDPVGAERLDRAQHLGRAEGAARVADPRVAQAGARRGDRVGIAIHGEHLGAELAEQRRVTAAANRRIDDAAAGRGPVAHRIGQDRNMVARGQCPPEKDESPACRGRRGRVRRPAKRVQAGLTGLEPATSGVTDRHSNQLSYSPLRRRVAI